MFKGHFLHTLDSKNRISIPSKLKKFISPAAENTLVLTKGVGLDEVGHCIDLYPKDLFAKIEDNLSKLNQYNKSHARFIRIFLHSAEEQTMDGQSRVIIPPHLLEYSKIEKEVLVLGSLNRIEFWNPAIYEQYERASVDSFENIAENVMQINGQVS
ncbi:MAG: division/cell wall cluster transcriptional repressor MraZ [Bacteroidetes bacterium]|nr:division/cell wall cluster transcriptional repressor MraZ [Bacteroidota bacterium]